MRMSSSSCLKHNLVIAEAGRDWQSESTYEVCNMWDLYRTYKRKRATPESKQNRLLILNCNRHMYPRGLLPLPWQYSHGAFIKIICSLLQDNLFRTMKLSTSYPFSNEATASAWDQYIKYLQVLPEMHVTSNVFKSVNKCEANYNKNRRCKQLCRTTNHASVLHRRLQNFHFMNRPARWA